MTHSLCKFSEIGADGKEVVLRHGSSPVYIMLIQRQGSVHAYLNVCPHQGRPLNLAPDRFIFMPDGTLMCPHHGASFRVEDGQCLEGPCKGSGLRPVPVKLVNEVVCLDTAIENLLD